jgi:hypothetical protein
MFHDWESFYLLVGSGAGALIGIMFLVATLTAGYDSKIMVQGARTYITPIVFHFTVILLLSIITAVPELPAVAVAAVFVLCAAVGIAYSLTTTFRMSSKEWPDPPDLEDKVFYGILPSLAYLTLAGATILLPDKGAVYAIGGVMLFLLIIGIRNAWDLASYFMLHPPTGTKK